MTRSPFESLSCSLLVQRGGHFSLGDIHLLVTIEAVGVSLPPRHDYARVRVLARGSSDTIVESRPDPDLDAIANLAGALRAVQFPGRTPALQAVVDTGEGWERLLLHVCVDGVPASVRLDLQWSGFEGPDAQRWCEVFASILRVARRPRDTAPAWARP